ncbi:hypothetical protein ADIWIN_3320 [Winogradskyella psychrotolerans RS-3]|uniref:DUF6705 domain-containing protein n=1 Tax=Winogradskyella psychrotolerans RS-3 TaxID=641526 RepID=S7X3L5_9FLAO|nr:DUF6705 family protein [Winogradskyella psychrotolerans]EPR70673.1 hypothetical protein ADIWIN_3320 [Winogradskyella psychrotolerans RS-3]
MKLYILNILLLFCLIGFGQTIKPVESEGNQENITVRGVYFKDVNNVLDKFVGTWKYENTLTNTVFEITFSKVINQERIFDNYADELSAQFKLSINGIEQYNTYTTSCEDCFIASGFRSYEEGFENDEFVYTEPNSNMYVGAIAEPNIEQYVLSSSLKLEYQFFLGNPAQLIWTNKASQKKRIATGEHMNVYQMPMNMVLIKQ